MEKTITTDDIIKTIKQPLWGKWTIRERIGYGASSVVYLVEAKQTNRIDKSALKIQLIVADRIFNNENSKMRYIENKKTQVAHEADILHRLKECPYIVSYEDEEFCEFYKDNKLEGYYFLMRMELLDCVFTLMEKKSDKFSCDEKNVLKLAHDIGTGIQYAHNNNIIHRDIKLGNFFVSKNGTYKLGDFNISKECDTASTLAGTQGYIAPEVYSATADIDKFYTQQADIYSFGISLYILMNNYRFPFDVDDKPLDVAINRRMRGESLPKPKNASEEFSKVILKACEFNCENRYKTMEEMLNDINDIINSNKKKEFKIPIDCTPTNGETINVNNETVHADEIGNKIGNGIGESTPKLPQNHKPPTAITGTNKPPKEKPDTDEPPTTPQPSKKGRFTAMKVAIPCLIVILAGIIALNNKVTYNYLGDCYYNGDKFASQDVEKAVEYYEKSAEKGYELAQYSLAECYYYGTGIEQDYEQAVHWYTKSAEQGNNDAQYSLGYCFQYGNGTTIDISSAIEWYTKSAEQGNSEAQYCLGRLYYEGNGVDKDYSKAVEWLSKSVEQENHKAEYILGDYYFYGDGGEQDDTKAIELYTKSADSGNSEAQ